MERRTVQLHYAKRFAAADDPAHTVRRVDPYTLIRLASDWLLAAYCHLRQDLRFFRLSRIDRLAVLTESFSRRRGSVWSRSVGPTAVNWSSRRCLTTISGAGRRSRDLTL